MKVRNKISRWAQVTSAIAVALVFGGGWLTVWKWSHIKLRISIARASRASQKAMALRAERMSLPGAIPSDWTLIDLGIASISAPPHIERIEAKGDSAVCITTNELEIGIPDYFGGRNICDDFRTRRQLQLLGADGRWHHAGYTDYSHAAGLASSDDFRWSLSLDQVVALQQLLAFKAMINDGVTDLFDGPNSKGVMTWVSSAAKPNVGGFGVAAICAMAKDERDGVVIWCRPKVKGGERLLPSLIESIQFPNKRYGGSADDLARHIASVIAKWNASTQPAQP